MKKKVVLILIIVFILSLLMISSVTFAKYILKRELNVQLLSSPLYFTVTPNSSTVQVEYRTATLELTLKNYENNIFNNFETEYEISLENTSKFSLEENIKGTLGGNEIISKIETIKFLVNDGIRLNDMENVTLKIKTTKPYEKEILLNIPILKEDLSFEIMDDENIYMEDDFDKENNKTVDDLLAYLFKARNISGKRIYRIDFFLSFTSSTGSNQSCEVILNAGGKSYTSDIRFQGKTGTEIYVTFDGLDIKEGDEFSIALDESKLTNRSIYIFDVGVIIYFDESELSQASLENKSVNDKNIIENESVKNENVVKNESVSSKNSMKNESVDNKNIIKNETVNNENVVKNESVSSKNSMKNESVDNKNIIKNESVNNENVVKKESISSKNSMKNESVSNKNIINIDKGNNSKI